MQVLCDLARITRLGEGLHAQPLFLPGAQERTFQVLKEYSEIAKSLGAQKIIAVGTAGFRKAKNAKEFVERVSKELGFTINIISGEEEARLSYLSAATDFPQLENLFVLDIGGGSTEIISKDGGVSLDMGAVILTEKIVKHDPPTEGELQEMQRSINSTLKSPHPPFFKGGNPGASPFEKGGMRGISLVALAGSVTTLSAIKQGLTTWDGSRVQGSKLSLSEIEEMISLFRRTKNEERRTIPGMVRGREDTILAGALILKTIMDHMGVKEVIVSDRGLRYGLFYERFNNNS